MNKLILRIFAVAMAFGISLSAVCMGIGATFKDNDISADITLPEENIPETDLPEEEPGPPETPGHDSPEETPETETQPEPEPEPEPQNVVYIRSKANGLNIRSGPGTAYESVGYIDKGDMVTLVEKTDSWYKTIYKNKTAYVSAASNLTEQYTFAPYQNETVQAVVEEGLKLLGFPYVYGAIRLHDGYGRKIKNFDATEYDCSSLMQYIYYHGAGVLLQMTTRTQVKQGTYVAKSDIARGDLLFFTNAQRYNNTGTERIGHVAMYLGDNYILHTATDYAVIEPISSTRWGYYIEARRVIEV